MSISIPSLAVVWFRRDLRLTDNAAWLEACRNNHSHIMPLMIINPDDWADDPLLTATSHEAGRVGYHRQHFWQQSIMDLQDQLAAVQQVLWVIKGHPDEALHHVITQLPIETPATIYVNREPGTDEATELQQVHTHLHGLARLAIQPTGQALYNNLPFKELPQVFTPFRQQVEHHAQVRLPVAPFRQVPNALPQTLRQGLTVAPFAHLTEIPPDYVPRYTGGRQAGLVWLHGFLGEARRIDQYKATRNQMLGDEGGSRLSPWLAHGCLSSAEVWQAIRDYEQQHQANDGTYWMTFELLWREYFRLLMYQHGAGLFVLKGLQPDKGSRWQADKARFRQWIQGKTGFPLVDAAMRELAATGYTSNRTRQNVASFMAKTWHLPWTWGARYFEQQLVDYDVASNWGNWAYVAGVGTDPRDRVFNVTKQAQDYDPEGHFRKRWLGIR
jgi:deoxyribodipyrimidine photo-lyase